ncbi:MULTISPECIES: transglycosylase SLT domain-containing protein [Methylobacter]|jgi:Transglycosylase SLT domain/Sel1 repeat|uniref:transglycosylase SLT domain-containing protein n=1 Tax=Methylobacter TaxID=429 RepID=UPI000568A982|nr:MULTISPECIES: transglycosylase SLT domain-containing protein [Methylobacter]
MSWNTVMIVVLLTLCSFWAQAAKVDHKAASIRKMAVAYEHGRGVKKDYRKAFKYYCRAAYRGDAIASYHLGFMYFYGRGVPRDLSLSMYWFRQSADKGDAYSQRMVKHHKHVKPVYDSACDPESRVARRPYASHAKRKIVESWVNKIAPAYGIDPKLVLAVIQAESAFNPRALSNKNAQGLMQLIPATAERFGVRDAWNPVQNIKGGTAYLNWLIHHFSGNVELVLAAYNAGEGAVERYHGVPPYEETQNYVKRILSRYKKRMHPIPVRQVGKPLPLHQAVVQDRPAADG